MSENKELKDLVGKKIKRLLISDDKMYISFECENGERLNYVAMEDCCSETWIEHVSGIDHLIGYTIKSVENIELGAGIGTSQEVDQLYGVEIKTNCGYGFFAFEYRNSSNGYYGGWMEKYKSELPEMKELKEDF